MPPRPVVEQPDAGSPPADINTELASLQTIGRALSDLPNDAARVRVLHWAAERFAPALKLPQLAPAAATAARDPLATEDLSDIFEDAGDRLPESEPRIEPAVRQNEPLESMVRGFVSDFQRIAREWDGEE